MASRDSIVNFNAREQALSSDLVRLQKLASRELQNLIADEERALVDPTLTAYGSVIGAGEPINAAAQLPGLISGPSTFDVTVGAGEAFLFDNTITGDDSPYQVVRWVETALAISTPDATDARVDLIVATPATENTDLESRNLLLDPVARTIAPQNVFKTQNPNATLSVVTGVPAALPPAVPAGAVAIFEVVVPPAAADASEFRPVRRIFRRVSGPFATAHGILAGCKLGWTDVNELTTSAGIFLDSDLMSSVVIDGETIDIPLAQLRSADSLVVQDSLANPFGSSAPAANDRAYYIYLVGGRNLPQWSGTFPPTVTGFPPVPILMVESTTSPDADGRPVTDIATPRGNTTRGALFIGNGFVVAGSTRRKPCVLSADGRWIHARDFAFGSSTEFTATPGGVGTYNAFVDVRIHSAPLSAKLVQLTPLIGASAANYKNAFGGTLAIMDAGANTTATLTRPYRCGMTFGGDVLGTQAFNISYNTGIVAIDGPLIGQARAQVQIASVIVANVVVAWYLQATGYDMPVKRFT